MTADFGGSRESRSYVLITAARNEARFIVGALESVLAQTVRPVRWIIVSDCSTDGTDEIAEAAANMHPFIEFLSSRGATRRSFEAKALAFRVGYRELQRICYEYIGNLDADVTFEPHYYERLLVEMGKNPRLGVVSGVCWDSTPDGFKCVTISQNHAVGAVQFFRRACFESIGGYQAVSVGGVDAIAERMARMRGWETKAFPELRVYHHKSVDSASARNAAIKSYRAGLTEYHIGTAPCFAVAKALRRWRDKPAVAGVLIRLSGYFGLWVRRVKRDALPELVAYLKREQRAAIKSWFFGVGGRRLQSW